MIRVTQGSAGPYHTYSFFITILFSLVYFYTVVGFFQLTIYLNKLVVV